MIVAAFVLPLLLLTAQDKKPATVPPAGALPAGAVKIDENTYKLKEKDGKTWVYRKTPFGVSRLPEEQFTKQNEAPLIQPAREAKVKVTDLGSEYKFERAHPFGIQVWKKAKKDLTADEQKYIDGAKVETAVEKKN
ncbi:hypothetical protein F183_A32990 [Bryobacterales bacterium F-183]|nr:hypothetical protein F183_A32990 [Bryobacterales bacterium F-183]